MGSGRTELLRAMLGLDHFNSGTVYYKKDATLQKIQPLSLLREVGYVTESRHTDGLFLDMDIANNCTSAKLDSYCKTPVHILDRQNEIRDTQELIQALNIKVPDYKSLASQLSGGNQQKVIFAKWLNKGA